MDTKHLLRLLTTNQSVSDGAALTFLSFWLSNLEGKPPPTYTELEALRHVARSTVQRHVEELERTGLLRAVRMPTGNKVYTLHPNVLAQPVAAPVKKETAPVKKPIGQYRTDELCSLFLFQAGITRSATRAEYGTMRRLHAEHGASATARMIVCFWQRHRKHQWGAYSIENLVEKIDVLKAMVGG